MRGRIQTIVMTAAFVVGLASAAAAQDDTMEVLRGSMIETLSQPFIVSVRARGLTEPRVVLRHALRNALGPLIAIVTVDAALLVSGAVVTESVFAWPGLGSLFTEALARRDYTVLMALLMLSASAVVAFNIVADIAHALVDPRVAAS